MNKFREIYDNELDDFEGGFIKHVLKHTLVRQFVYEVCKNTIQKHNEYSKDKKCPTCATGYFKDIEVCNTCGDARRNYI